MGQWTWNWPNSGNNVKAYPEVIFGQKPGNLTTSADLPRKIDSIDELTIEYDVISTHTGSGNLAFDFWLTDTENPSTWGVPPITQEIMIWLDRYGGMQPGGSWVEQINIDGALYSVYKGENYGQGWRYIAFVQENLPLEAGTLNLVNFLSYMRDKSFVAGDEYIASIEFGNEVIGGTGETILNKYEVSVR